MKKITLLAAFFAVFAMNAQIVFTEDFNAEPVDSTIFTNWDSIDQDGDTNFWEVADMLAYATGTSGAVNHPMQTNAADSDSWEGSALTPDNFLITKNPIDLSFSTGTSLSYQVGSYQINGTFVDDKYSIYLTTSNDPAIIVTETPVLTRLVGDDAACDQADGSASAADVSIDISAFDGQVVYLTFRHYDTVDQNSVLIDNISIDSILSVNDDSFNNFVHFVDANNQLNLSADTSMESLALYNMLGQEVLSQKLNSTNEAINIASLQTGVYIASVSIEGNRKSFKIIKN